MGKLPKIKEENKEIPIGARFRGPGPAAYNLQSTIANNLYNKKKAPAYSFGVKFTNQKKIVTPGPDQYSTRATRTGIETTPAYSILGRNFPQRLVNENPGPNKYYSNFYQSKNVCAPSYSIYGRLPQKRVNNNPGPAQYNIKSEIGVEGPAWSLHPSYKKRDTISSPGPANYNTVNINTIKKAPPAYSLYFRENVAGQKVNVPGPGAYNINLQQIKKNLPAFSFGIKHSEFELQYREDPADPDDL